MDFYGLKCPTCNTPLEKDDDIVVCPICGAPHHRECYEEAGHCYFEDRHKDNFDYDKYIKEKQEAQAKQQWENAGAQDTRQEAPQTVICPSCGEKNPSTGFYCSKCGAQLNPGGSRQGEQPFSGPNGQQYNPQGGMPFGAAMFDPMAGVDPNEELDEGVTAGEAAKYVQKNTPYFIRIFKNIKDYNKSRFNFCAFLFTGGYMLYRKMYKIGTVFTILVGMLSIGTLLIETLPVFGWMDIFSGLVSDIGNVSQFEFYQSLASNVSSLPIGQQLVFYAPYVFSLLKWVLMFVAGGIANKAYFKTVIKKTKKIKDETEGDFAERTKKLDFSGGVNTTLALILLISYGVVSFLPYFFI